MGRQVPEIVYSPCCEWHRAYVQSESLSVIERAAKSAKALHGWRYTLRAFPPYWQLYFAAEDLEPEELELVKRGEGPSQVVNQLMGQ